MKTFGVPRIGALLSSVTRDALIGNTGVIAHPNRMQDSERKGRWIPEVKDKRLGS